MENEIMNVTECVPDLVRNSHVSLKLEGWPASAAVIAICISGVVIYGIKTFGIQSIFCKEKDV
jgi:hypothetical protein